MTNTKNILQSNIIPINIPKLYKRKLYRYIPLKYVQSMIEDKILTFVNPKLWNDPFERIYLETDYSKLGYTRPNKVYCLCTRNSIDNEEASWKVYSDGKEPLIRVELDIVHLFEQLETFAKQHNCNLYFAQVDYTYKENEIRKELSTSPMFYNDFFSNFSEKSYVRLMSLKRPAFAYEKEFRLFVVPQLNSDISTMEDILQVPIKYNMFRRFDICPCERIREEDKNKWTLKVKKNQYQNMVLNIRKLIQSKIPSVTVMGSNLYKDVSPIKKIV